MDGQHAAYPSSDIIEVQSAGPIALPKCYSQPACATASYEYFHYILLL